MSRGSAHLCRHHCFWPIKAGTINIDKLDADRDQPFAEAVVRYREGVAGGRPRISSANISCRNRRSDMRANAWEENIATYIGTKDRVTVGQIARECLHIETPRIGTADQRRIAAALGQLG